LSVSSLRHKQSRVEPGTLARPAYLWFFVVANVSMWIQHLQDKAAAARGVSGRVYTLAGGRRGTAGLTPAEIEEKAQAAVDRGRTTRVFIYIHVYI
jgi:hypothetical protein